MAIVDKTRKALWARSGNRCAICKTELVLDKDPFNRRLNLGEECHIISKQVNGPRYDVMDEGNYDEYENLILLCCNHHKMVDEQIEKFAVEVFRDIKKDHEIWVRNNLTQDGIDVAMTERSTFSDLINYVSTKHDIEMNLVNSKAIFESERGLEIAFAEVADLKNTIVKCTQELIEKAPQYRIIVRDNDRNICDIIFKGFTLLAQFYQVYSNVPDDSYIFLSIVNGVFDRNGYSDPFNPAVVVEIARLDFSYNNEGLFGWRDQENNDMFYSSPEIATLWIDKFFRHVLDE